MGYEISWHTKDAIVHVRTWGDLKIEQFPEMDKLILDYINQSDRILVHVWVDLREVTEFPPKIWQVQKTLTHLNHARVGWSIIITENRLIRFVGSTITQIAKARFRAFNNTDEAMKFLQYVDPNLEVASI